MDLDAVDTARFVYGDVSRAVRIERWKISRILDPGADLFGLSCIIVLVRAAEIKKR